MGDCMPIKIVPITHKEMILLERLGTRATIKPCSEEPPMYATGGLPVTGTFRTDKTLISVWEDEYEQLNDVDLTYIEHFHHIKNKKLVGIKERQPTNCWVLVCQ